MHIGTAGWAIRRDFQDAFPGGGSHLARYAARLNAVEINSSFYRPHRASTYARWAAETPDGFRFSVKLPKAITHERRLADAGGLLDAFLAQCGALGEKLGCLLIQLPPSLAYTHTDFFARLRERYDGPAALEPRHLSWFTPAAEALLLRHRIARVAADPPVGPFAPHGPFEYWRLHGSPRIYYSDYDDAFLHTLSERADGDAWVIFDNTALGHATANALALTSAATCTKGPRPASRSRRPAA
ncbi:MAG TPA: DUF72 domain-containing protein [Rhizomicrobium sp.]|nr:DUF72 domain-containing protein [Rhizomicrobium sp.]